jgi:hypothetical protein
MKGKIPKKIIRIMAGIDDFLSRAGFPAIKKARDIHLSAGLIRTKKLKTKAGDLMICKVKKTRAADWIWEIRATEKDLKTGFYPYQNCSASMRFKSASDAAIDLMRHLTLIENQKHGKGKK